MAFAGVPQVSRKTFWCLRESRKSLGKLFGVCGSPASLSENFLAFAGVPQASRETFWRLRESRKRLRKCGGTQRDLRKRLGKCRGTCAACANVLVNAAELAQPAQTSRQIPRNLRNLRKRLGKCRGTCAACANVSANAAELARLAQTWGSWGGVFDTPLQPDGKSFHFLLGQPDLLRLV